MMTGAFLYLFVSCLCGFGGDLQSVGAHDLRQWCNDLHVRLWEVTGSAINTALVPVLVNLINQMNDIVFLRKTEKKERLK